MATNRDPKGETPIDVNPENQPVTRNRARYLAAVTGRPEAELQKLKVGELADSLRWRIDPTLLFFRRICGRVVKKNPTTGALEGVPYATVTVLDTDWSFWGFFPNGNPWWWLWPFFNRTEEIGRVRTDACGHFCVFIPRWDIDRILQFRRVHWCLPDIYRPNVRDVLDRLPRREEKFPHLPPRPGPDPSPIDLATLRAASATLDPAIVKQLGAIARTRTFGERVDADPVLEQSAFPVAIAPPMPASGPPRPGRALDDGPGEQHRFSTVAGDLDLVGRIDPRSAVGPFLRCFDAIVAEWETIIDVPDITFRVTQDVNGDGVEEIIYSESIFDVRWDAGDIPDVTLVADPIAVSVPSCAHDDVPCSGVPEISVAGLMPLAPTHHNDANGYAIRPNRPKIGPSGHAAESVTSPSFAPYAGTVQLRGCHHIANATHYRVTYQLVGGAELPFTETWYEARLALKAGAVLPDTPSSFFTRPDANGWYPIRPFGAAVPPEDQSIDPHFLINWQTSNYANGAYSVRLEVGSPVGGVTAVSGVKTFRIDNSGAGVTFHAATWQETGGPVKVLPIGCAVVRRSAGHHVFVTTQWTAHAEHLFEVDVAPHGCTVAGEPEGFVGAAADDFHHYISDGDNTYTRTSTFEVLPAAPDGVYHVTSSVSSRAFSPSGGGAGPTLNWFIDEPTFHATGGFDFALITT